MSRVRDLVQLKRQQRLIQEKLSTTDVRMDRLNEILSKKTVHLKSSGIVRPNPDEATFTDYGMTVADLRMPARSSKVTLKPIHFTPVPDREPRPVLNENILRIRLKNVRNTVCKREIRERQKLKDARIAERQKKEKQRQYPKCDIPQSFLPNRYLRGELPCTIEHGANGMYLSWACPLENLDYDYYLPVFFDGLQCKDHPSAFIAQQGIEDLLIGARGHPEWIIPVLPKIVRYMRNALAKFDPPILMAVLKVMRELVECNAGIGDALLPYTKQFLTPMAVFLDQNKNTGDAIDYGQRRNKDLGEEVRTTLECLEEHCGPGAFFAIKSAVPLYESCVRPTVLRAQQQSASK